MPDKIRINSSVYRRHHAYHARKKQRSDARRHPYSSRSCQRAEQNHTRFQVPRQNCCCDYSRVDGRKERTQPTGLPAITAAVHKRAGDVKTGGVSPEMIRATKAQTTRRRSAATQISGNVIRLAAARASIRTIGWSRPEPATPPALPASRPAHRRRVKSRPERRSICSVVASRLRSATEPCYRVLG
jgi:hypothetical protein